MKSLGTGLMRLFIGFCRGLRDEEFQAIIFLLGIALGTGTIFYHF